MYFKCSLFMTSALFSTAYVTQSVISQSYLSFLMLIPFWVAQSSSVVRHISRYELLHSEAHSVVCGLTAMHLGFISELVHSVWKLPHSISLPLIYLPYVSTSNCCALEFPSMSECVVLLTPFPMLYFHLSFHCPSLTSSPLSEGRASCGPHRATFVNQAF